MSLIHTAELNGVNPFDYLVALQRHHERRRRGTRRLDALELQGHPHATREGSRPAEVTSSRWPGPHAGGHHRPRTALD